MKAGKPPCHRSIEFIVLLVPFVWASFLPESKDLFVAGQFAHTHTSVPSPDRVLCARVQCNGPASACEDLPLRGGLDY